LDMYLFILDMYLFILDMYLFILDMYLFSFQGFATTCFVILILLDYCNLVYTESFLSVCGQLVVVIVVYKRVFSQIVVKLLLLLL